MATVRLSDQLKRTILDSVLKPFHDRESQLAQKIPRCFNADEIYGLLVPANVREAGALLPDTLYYKSTTFFARFNGSFYEFTLSQMHLIPDEWRNRYSTKLPRIQADYPGYREAMELVNQIASTSKERTAVETNIKELLDKNVTLGQLLKIWPNASAHVPQEVMTRFNKHTEKKPAASTEELTSLLDNVAVSLAKATLLKQTSS